MFDQLMEAVRALWPAFVLVVLVLLTLCHVSLVFTGSLWNEIIVVPLLIALWMYADNVADPF